MKIEDVDFKGFNNEYAETTVIEHKGVSAFIREGTSDRFVVKEVLGGEYRKLNIQSGDVVVDFGMNIGMFSVLAMKSGAKEIHSFEPEKENFQIAMHNAALNGFKENVNGHNKAVVGDDDVVRHFSVNIKKNKGAHSLISKRGRDTVEVQCININDVLESCRPDVVKMDIEGGEYEALRAVKSFEGIRELMMEYHHAHLNDIPEQKKFHEIVSLMQDNFDHVEYRKEPKGAWVSTIYCRNDL